MNPSRTIKVFSAVVVVVILVVIVGLVLFKKTPNQAVVAESQAPQFDIVSGDINSSTAQTILSQVEQTTGTKMGFSDLTIRKDTYHKTFSSDQYPTITMLLDTKNPTSTYQVTVSTTATYQNSVLVVCAPATEQIDISTGCFEPAENSL